MIPYLRLVRLPNVFTALADIAAGATVVRATFPGMPTQRWLPLAAASGALYLAGMAFNDVADRAEDARVRPQRPIPSGAVSLRGAVICGVLLMLAGLGAALAVDSIALAYAGMLAAAILGYDFAAKHFRLLGPAVLGLCRYLNVSMGMSAHPNFGGNMADPGFFWTFHAPALAVGIYAAGLTAFSAQEESGKRLGAILLGWALSGSGLLLAGLSAPKLWIWAALAPLIAVLAWDTRRLAKTGTPLAARTLVKHGVMGICFLDAGLILGFGGSNDWKLALGVAALFLPGAVLAKLLAQKEA